jgi:hypothetical protein
MSLTILNVAYPLAPVGSGAVGGAEQVLTLLDRALVEAGHRSIVIACAGSTTAGHMVEVEAETGVLDEPAKRRAEQRHRRAIAEALERWPIDVVHLHGIDFYRYLPPPGVPVLATLHLPLSWYPLEALKTKRPATFFQCVSQPQHDTAPEGMSLLPPIENGVPVDALKARHAKRDYAMVLGRVCPEKGMHLAIDAAKRADIGLLLAGTVFPYAEHRRYFDDEIAPRLDGRRRFIGPVDFRRKRRLLTAARCLLVPSLAPETSSLVAREALACGTPVVAFASGALPATVEHGRTGFLVSDVDEMARAIGKVGLLDAEHCRQVARERFSLKRMVARYFETYAALGRLRADASLEPTS